MYHPASSPRLPLLEKRCSLPSASITPGGSSPADRIASRNSSVIPTSLVVGSWLALCDQPHVVAQLVQIDAQSSCTEAIEGDSVLRNKLPQESLTHGEFLCRT